MKLYSGPLSLFSRKVEIALGEKGLAYEREMVPFTQARGYSPKHPAVLAANPKAQVPVLVDGDLTLFDSTIIAEYLEEAYPGTPLFPAGAQPRARCRLLELYGDEILFAPVRRMLYRTEPPHPDPKLQALREEEGRQADAAIRAVAELVLLKPDFPHEAHFGWEIFRSSAHSATREKNHRRCLCPLLSLINNGKLKPGQQTSVRQFYADGLEGSQQSPPRP